MTTTFKHLCHSSYCPFHSVYFVFPTPLYSLSHPSSLLLSVFLSPPIISTFSLLLSSLFLSSCHPFLPPFFSSSSLLLIPFLFQSSPLFFLSVSSFTLLSFSPPLSYPSPLYFYCLPFLFLSALSLSLPTHCLFPLSHLLNTQYPLKALYFPTYS